MTDASAYAIKLCRGLTYTGNKPQSLGRDRVPLRRSVALDAQNRDFADGCSLAWNPDLIDCAGF
jgi:hypothetical protein